MSTTDFGKLPDDYARLLRLAKEKHNLDVVPLDALSGGQTGAMLFLVSVSVGDLRQIEHFILKFDRAGTKSKRTEFERHRLALSQAPEEFAKQNIPQLAYEIEDAGSSAIFYTIAGQSLQRFRTLASNERQSRLETLFSATTDYLLKSWNSESTFEQAVHPRDLLERWLGYRLGPEGRLGSFLDSTSVDRDTEGFLVEGQIFPNPVSYGVNAGRWKGARPIDALTGFQHGDLNIGNILAKFGEGSEDLGGYFLIDFALFKSGMPLLYDQRYLEMSYLIRELDRVGLKKWVAFVSQYASRDLPDPKEVPVELAGACTVISAATQSFARWVKEVHPSLADDLWGQFRLAAVAAGLNFCNKMLLSDEERLAGLIFSAVHLKRYCIEFGIQLPTEVSLLYDGSKWNEGSRLRKPGGATTARRGNLPIQPTPFIGRDTELSAVKDLILRENVRLVTLTGPGGTGKTRLALETAGALADRFSDGAYFIDLAPLRQPEAVIVAMARVLGVKETSEQPLLEELQEGLRGRKILLVLDNFEQVTAAASDVAELLRGCPELKLIVTSREAMHVRGEQLFPVPPLGLPDADSKHPSVDQLGRYEGIRLFIERAQAVKPDFELTPDNAPAVAEICLRLDGLPLAIELATARLSLFSPQVLLARVGGRMKLLRGGARDLPVRQQTLHDTIEWSYQLLDVGEQRLFALLSGFSGCTLDAVEAVAEQVEYLEETGVDVLDGLTSLVDKSLIRQAVHGPGEPRFVMLETIREYAEERLDENEVFKNAIRQAHAAYFAEFTQRQWPRLSGPGREPALADIEFNLDNIRSAWTYWAAEGDFEELRKLTDCLWMTYESDGSYHAMVDLAADLLKVLAATPSTPERAEQEILLQTSLARTLMAIKGCTQEVEAAYKRALEICQDLGAVPQLFPVLRGLAAFYVFVGALEKGAQLGEQILSLAESQDDDRMRVEGHLVLGYSLAFVASLNEGLDHLQQGTAFYNPDRYGSSRFRLGNDPGVACYTTSALILWMQGFPDRALVQADKAISLANKLNHPFSSAYAQFHTGLLHLWRREEELAQERAQGALQVALDHEFQIWRALATCLEGAALAGMGQTEEGLNLTNRGIDLYQDLKTPPVFWPLLLVMRAEVSGLADRPADGVALLDEALDIVGTNPGFILSAEPCRLKGVLLHALSQENASEAEDWLRQAIVIARDREAVMLELRATVGLSRLLAGQGKQDEGRQLMNDVLSKITEGFGTRDIQDAKALLADLQ